MTLCPPTPIQDNLHALYKSSRDRFGPSFNSAVINDMRKLGYQIENFGLRSAAKVNLPMIHRGTAQSLFVREKDIQVDIPQGAMSNGMLRALAILIFFHSCRLAKNRDCLLIDDIGEGLDFDRSTKLIKLLVEEAEKGYLQLVMTTNDRFVMNAVPIQYWSIIQRVGGRVEVINKSNSSDRFQEFEEWGFNNFDFFAKRLYESKKA